MSASNHRNKAYNTYHHLGSRIAHRVYFLREDERNEFVDRMFRVAAFTGVELVGWCIMTNHFHILAYLPRPVELDEEEVLHRYSILKGKDAMHFLAEQFKQWRATPGSEALVGRELVRLKSMMYSIAWFMKIIKQWTTEEYNRRYSHKGTLWEATYFDRVVDDTLEAKAHALGYVHLNPIRAAASAGYDDYPWSSFTALHSGSVAAIRGMRRVYGDDASVEAMSESHIALMDDLLGEMKRKRAVEIARRRAAGYEVPPDPLTDESMVAQAAAHLEMVQHAGTELAEQRRRGRPRDSAIDERIISVITSNPSLSPLDIVPLVGSCKSLVYARLSRLRKRGIISRSSRSSPWCINSIKSQTRSDLPR